MNKNKKIDIVKIKAIVGLIMFIFCIITGKLLNVYYLYGKYRLEIGASLFVLMVVSLFLMAPYNRRI
jgi:uncharacterized integral membrane protein